jgi:hypothetical protein
MKTAKNFCKICILFEKEKICKACLMCRLSNLWCQCSWKFVVINSTIKKYAINVETLLACRIGHDTLQQSLLSKWPTKLWDWDRLVCCQVVWFGWWTMWQGTVLFMRFGCDYTGMPIGSCLSMLKTTRPFANFEQTKTN